MWSAESDATAVDSSRSSRRLTWFALIAGALTALAAFVALTVAVVQSQRDARASAIERFDDRGKLSAQLLAGVMGQSSTRQAADAQVRLSGRVDTATLRSWEGESDPAIPYTALYDQQGRQLAANPANAPAVRSASGKAALRAATTGKPATSGVIENPKGPVIESFVPFPSPDGIRVLVISFPSELIAQLASGTLSGSAGTPSGGAFLLDRAGNVVTAVGKGAKSKDAADAVVAAVRHKGRDGAVGDDRFVLRDVSGTWLSVALVAPERELTADLPDSAWPRVALAGFGLALLAVFSLAARALRDARRLAVARRAADRANAAKSRFLAHITHELKNPLAIIRGFGDLLTRSDIDEQQRSYASHIMTAEQQLAALVNELLDISRIEAGKMTLAIEPVDLAEAVDEVLRLTTPLARERDIRLQPCHVEGSTRPALADPIRLRQVLLNLISNAIKYSLEGGTVGTRIEPARDQTVRVAITDSGEGLSPDKLAKLFVPFERLGKESGRVAGSGLGLVITKGLIEAMHGELQVTSIPGSGTTFAFELPAVDASTHRVTRAAAPAPLARESVTGDIVYIDDSVANLELVQQIVAGSRPGITLRTASEGQAGTQLVEQHTPDLLLLDLNLPDMTGEQVLRRMRARDETADVPILILSSDSTSRDVTRLLRTGADAYVTKPFEIPQLLDVIDRLLATR